MIDLYTWATPNGRKISIMLEELGVLPKDRFDSTKPVTRARCCHDSPLDGRVHDRKLEVFGDGVTHRPVNDIGCRQFFFSLHDVVEARARVGEIRRRLREILLETFFVEGQVVQTRFEIVERLAVQRSIDLQSASLETLDQLWDIAKGQ